MLYAGGKINWHVQGGSKLAFGVSELLLGSWRVVPIFACQLMSSVILGVRCCGQAQEVVTLVLRDLKKLLETSGVLPWSVELLWGRSGLPPLTAEKPGWIPRHNTLVTWLQNSFFSLPFSLTHWGHFSWIHISVYCFQMCLLSTLAAAHTTANLLLVHPSPLNDQKIFDKAFN